MENSPTEFQHKKCSQKWLRDFSSYMKYNAIEGAFLIWAATWQNQQVWSESSLSAWRNLYDPVLSKYTDPKF